MTSRCLLAACYAHNSSLIKEGGINIVKKQPNLPII